MLAIDTNVDQLATHPYAEQRIPSSLLIDHEGHIEIARNSLPSNATHRSIARHRRI
jgi:hypothetical protein